MMLTFSRSTGFSGSDLSSTIIDSIGADAILHSLTFPPKRVEETLIRAANDLNVAYLKKSLTKVKSYSFFH
jgi:hypothetical protein